MEDTRYIWNKAYLEALDFDAWGQVEEAVNGYQRLQVAASVEHAEDVLNLQPARREAIGLLATVLKQRIQELNADSNKPIGLAGMQSLKPFLASLIVSDVTLPPTVAQALKSLPPKASATSGPTSASTQQQQQQGSTRTAEGFAGGSHNLADAADSTVEVTSKLSLPCKGNHQQSKAKGQELAATNTSTAAATGSAGTLRLPPEHMQSGSVTVSIEFGSWFVKGADKMVNPHIVLTVHNKLGELLEAVQESPHIACHPSDPSRLALGFTWHMQTPVNHLPEGSAVFCELRHYKPDKKKNSMKCYAYLEANELTSAGAAALETYKKPVDYKRKGRPTLFTSKAMYLHIVRNLHEH